MRLAARMPLLLFLLLPAVQAAAQQNENGAAPAHLSLDQILTNLERKNAQRAAALEQFEGKRTYRMQYRGFFSEHDAEMTVKVRFEAPDSKQFTIISESGSTFVIREHARRRTLRSRIAAQNEKQVLIPGKDLDRRQGFRRCAH